MSFLKIKVPFYNQIQWQTFRIIWNSLKAKELIPFLFRFLKERFRLQRSNFGKEWKTKRPTNQNKLNPIDLIAFYIAYKEVTNTERALKLLFKILKQQSADVFLEMVEVFRKYGIRIS